MTVPLSDSPVQHTHFRQFGRIKALCRDDRCSWKYVANSMGTVNRHAMKHVRGTGHEVEVERHQWKIVRLEEGR